MTQPGKHTEDNLNRKPYTLDRVVRLVIGLLILVFIFLLVKRLSNVLLPFFIAFLLAYYLDPIVVFFQKKVKIRKRGLAVLCTLLSFLIILADVLWIIIPQITNEAVKLSKIVSDYSNNFNIGSLIPPAWQEQIKATIATLDFKALLNNDNILNEIKRIAPGLWSMVTGSLNFLLGFVVIGAVMIYLIFILLDYDNISSGLFQIVPPKYRKLSSEILSDLQVAMNRYFRGQALVALLTGIILIIGFSIIKLPMAIAMGILIGVLNMVPYLQGFGLIPCGLLGILQSAETGQSIWTVWLGILIVFLVAQGLQDWFIAPRVMGKVTGLNPAIILLSLSIWGALMGIIGMIIALPVTTIIISYYKRFVLREDDDGVALPDETPPVSEPETKPEKIKKK